MKRFFDTLDSLCRHTANLDALQLLCTGCQRAGQFVSHGFIYRHLSSQKIIVVGKRILCSPRGDRSGCGRTIRLYLTVRLPRLHYDSTALTLFICALLAGDSIAQAYQQATSQIDTRHAYRWLRQLQRQLPLYRYSLLTHHFTTTPEIHGPQQHHHTCLYASLRDLFNGLAPATCAAFQWLTQHAFL